MGGNLGVTMFSGSEELAHAVEDVKQCVWWRYGEALAVMRFCVLNNLPTPDGFEVPRFSGELRDKSREKKALVALAMQEKLALLHAEYSTPALPGFVPEPA
ncbi:hypothetical protein HF668_07000 [Acidithiobacillus ferridurans]|uniref:hypothetical protein n=1 Tax=Acidithiobacillus ferridurans TaxID=1232575 RepID=UPI001C07A72F|nr:hypothetical protein [Acidithiobacillus ferridurans]MBU2804896.1 hypothetical protein [Acidithiobacillus ferridurans]